MNDSSAEGLPAKPSAARLPEQTLFAGDLVNDRYEVKVLLGRGGMGEVYDVVHLGLGRHFALKCQRTSEVGEGSAVNRFLKEVRALAAVQSEFVVTIFDCGTLGNRSPYFVMELLEGADLRKVIKEHERLPVARALGFAIDACLGVQAMHDAGLVHRDLKPENLFVIRASDQKERCKVLDFGIAKGADSHSTKRGAFLGTLKYMAPEQIADASKVGPWTDVYALGAILYECIGGRAPHVADTEPELMFKIMNEAVQPLAAVTADVDEGLSLIVSRALQREPSKRFSSATGFAAALTSHLLAASSRARELGVGTTERHEEVPRATERRNPRSLALAGILVFVFGILCGLVVQSRSSTSSAETRTLPSAMERTPRALEPGGAVSEPALAKANASALPVAIDGGSIATPVASVSTPPASKAVPVIAKTRSDSVRPGLPSLDTQSPYEFK